MSWLFGGSPKSNLPPITPLQEQRSKQIHSLRTLNPSIVELKRDEQYRLTLSAGGNNIALIISLPPQFPQDKPLVKVSPALNHPWVSKSLQVTGCASLNNFGVHSDLGRVIQSIAQELRHNPPLLISSTTGAAAEPVQQPGAGAQPPPSYQPYSSPASMQLPRQGGPQHRPSLPQRSQQPPQQLGATHNSIAPGAAAAGGHSQSAPVDVVKMLGVEPMVPPTGMVTSSVTYQPPPITALFDNLHLGNKSMQELQELYENEAKVMDIVKESAQVKQMLHDRTKLYDDCEQLSGTNLSYKPVIEKKKDELLQKVQDRNDMKNKFDFNSLQQQSNSERFLPENILDNLRVSAAEAEHDSEKLADNFLEGKVPIDDFLKQYTDLRKTLHLKKAKEEKLDHMIQKNAIRY
ncbi:vacuolar protein sorting-associated protein 37A-like [Amphiura filiformis]|uniref:vacuolar protein sorting-associated protein 37A-like n=1 Tax=Amphiura filiformis TaxID=82378 RepID=UPI003B22034F